MAALNLKDLIDDVSGDVPAESANTQSLTNNATETATKINKELDLDDAVEPKRKITGYNRDSTRTHTIEVGEDHLKQEGLIYEE